MCDAPGPRSPRPPPPRRHGSRFRGTHSKNRPSPQAGTLSAERCRVDLRQVRVSRGVVRHCSAIARNTNSLPGRSRASRTSCTWNCAASSDATSSSLVRKRSVESDVSLVPSVWNTTVLRNETNGNATSVTSFHVSTTPTRRRGRLARGSRTDPTRATPHARACGSRTQTNRLGAAHGGPPEASRPSRRLREDLGNVPHHRRYIDLHRREVRRHTMNPANAIGACLAPRDGQHCAAGSTPTTSRSSRARRQASVPVPHPMSATARARCSIDEAVP